MRFVLRRAHQRYLFMNRKHHKSDGFQVAIQLLVVTTKEIYMATQAVCAKGLNVDFKGIPLVMLVVHEQVAPMNSS